MNNLLGCFEVFLIHPNYLFHFAHHFFYAGACVVTKARLAGGYVLRQKTEVFKGFKHTAFFKVVVRESWFRAAEAGVVGPRLARLTIPQDTVATGAGHRASATYFIKEAAAAFAEAAVHLLGKTDSIRASGLYKIGEKRFWAMEIVDQYVPDSAGSNSDQYL